MLRVCEGVRKRSQVLYAEASFVTNVAFLMNASDFVMKS